MQVSVIRSSPIQAAFIATGIYVLPMLFTPHLASLAPWLGAVAAWLLLVSQPAVEPIRLWSHSGRDRGSAAWIFTSMIATQLAAVAEYRLYRGLIPLHEGASMACGIIIVIGGFALRLWSIQTLGRFFTSTVEVVGEQPVIRTGPYAWVRHPSYTGALLIALGLLLMMRSMFGFAFLALTVVPAYAYRIRVEENVMVVELGAPYARYRREVSALVPRSTFGRLRER